MAAYRRVYDSRHLQADSEEPGSAPEPYTLDNRVWATFTFLTKGIIAGPKILFLFPHLITYKHANSNLI